MSAKQSLAVMSSSQSVEWYTPAAIVASVREVLGPIELDPASCAVANTTVGAERFYTKELDGLLQPWQSTTLYLNPPYGAAIQPWIERLVDQYESGSIGAAIALVPARVDTQWWWRLRHYPVCFLAGRLRFSNAQNSAPFPCAVFYLGRDEDRFISVFGALGLVYQLATGTQPVRGRSDAYQHLLALEAM